MRRRRGDRIIWTTSLLADSIIAQCRAPRSHQGRPDTHTHGIPGLAARVLLTTLDRVAFAHPFPEEILQLGQSRRLAGVDILRVFFPLRRHLRLILLTRHTFLAHLYTLDVLFRESRLRHSTPPGERAVPAPYAAGIPRPLTTPGLEVWAANQVRLCSYRSRTIRSVTASWALLR